MSALLDRALAHLEWLVACDSTNPPRKPEALVARLVRELELRFAVDVRDLGDGCVTVFATRGSPRVAWNAHVDTVPVAPGWTRDPFRLVVDRVAGHATGLGACDTKGAVAAMLAAAEHTEGPAALVFTTDEEAGKAVCARDFAARARELGLEAVTAAEPTSCRAVFAHRGVATGALEFFGRAAHSSTEAGASASANHALVAWAARALELAGAEGNRRDARFNLGRLDGGEKPNVIAARAEARFGVRPPAGEDPRAALAEFAALAGDGESVFRELFVGPTCPAPGERAPELEARARELATGLGLEPGAPVDFWTEAAIFSAHGLATFVFGPGRIDEAHGPDEHVSLDELERAASAYARAFAGGPA